MYKKKKPLILWGRLFYIYGEGQNPRTLYGQLNRSIKEKKEIFNMSQGDQTRDYLNINNVIKIIINILIKSNKSDEINLCSGNTVNLQDLENKWLKKKK